MTGLRQSVTASISARGPSSTTGPLINFDEFWPIAECVEQIAVHLRRESEKEFGLGVARMAAAGDITVQVQLAWVVNELLERSPGEQSLGKAVAAALGEAAGLKHARGALHILAEYKKVKGGEDAKLFEGIEKTDPFIAAREKEFQSEVDELIERVLVNQRTVAAKIVDQVTFNLFADHDFSPNAIQEAAIKIGAACNVLLASATPDSGLDGIAALAAVRLILRDLCSTLTKHEEFAETNGLPILAARLFSRKTSVAG